MGQETAAMANAAERLIMAPYAADEWPAALRCIAEATNSSFAQIAVTAATANGATGIGAGVGYMGPKTLHIGFGTSVHDNSKVVWGAGGRSVNAPSWLKRAAQKGWDNPVADAGLVASDGHGPGRFVVVSRGGLNLRKGPGVAFGITKTIETGN